MKLSFVLTGGGTGGHIFPALAVADQLRSRGHRLLFVGTENGMESRLVPQAGYDIEFVRSGALNRVGVKQQLQTLLGLPGGVLSARTLLKRFRPQAIFSTGGFASGPVMLAALLLRIPLIVMEPNAIPGFANRRVGKYVYRALLGFESTRSWFAPGKSEVTGLPVRSEFFSVQPKVSGPFTVLITGGSRGARTLNRAARESWSHFTQSADPIRMVLQTGAQEYEKTASEFAQTGLPGEVVPFIASMAKTFSNTDLVIGRSGAGGVSEIAAAQMASVLVPFPFAADNHQQRNAEMLAQAGAARMVLDSELSGKRLYEEIETLRRDPDSLARMRANVRPFGHPGAAERAAAVLEEAANQKKSLKSA
jgi:UDP-N-acetylglucosamine--N-acetylmuramyl-(pentapeptide) pyrophosphoryl-undecaprenol N-acetylglucosamine transferase